MDTHTAHLLLQLLQRANITGADVGSWLHCVQVLENIIRVENAARAAAQQAAVPEAPQQRDLMLPPAPSPPGGEMRRPNGA